MELGFKVVRRVPDHAVCDDPPAYLSAMDISLVLSYRIGRVTEPDHTESGPVAVFGGMRDAEDFMHDQSPYPYKMTILVVLYEPTNEKVLWKWSVRTKDVVMTRITFPQGTRFARSVRVLAEVPGGVDEQRVVLKSLPLAG